MLSKVLRQTARSQPWQRCLLRWASSSTDVAKPKPVEVAAREAKLPVERTSLSRGLALNKFEKDFVIYPEFTETDEVEAIKEFTNKLNTELTEAVAKCDVHAKEFSNEVLAVLLKNGVFFSFVPEDYGGVGMGHKQLLCLYEALGIDLPTTMLVNQSFIASHLIQQFGTTEQKKKYLPRLATFQMKPAICLADLKSGESAEVVGSVGGGSKLNGYKADVLCGDIADFFIVFAYDTPIKGSTERTYNCYIVDKDAIGDGKIVIAERQQTHGLLPVHMSKINFCNVTVNESNLLGDRGHGRDVANEVAGTGNFYVGSAVVGFLKNLISELAKLANTSLQGERRLAENLAVQRSLSHIAMSTFILESILYYVGGLTDEGLVLSTDIENAITQLLVNRVLREAFVTITEVSGSAATDDSFPYDRMIRDASTLLSLNINDLSLIKTISLSMLVTWVEESNFENRFHKAQAIKRMFHLDKLEKAWNNPKMKHFIAEHVHPSLEPACRFLEHSMARLDMTLNRISEDAGSKVAEEVATMSSLSTVLQNNLAMIAVIARASRSYSIGLRNADIELAWAISFCRSAARESEAELQFLIDHFGLIRLNPTLVNVGAAVVEFGGYPLERPIERNW